MKRTSETDYANVAQRLMAKGFCTIKATWLTQPFLEVVNDYDSIADDTKATFSFPERTDGFLPFGMEHSSSSGHADQCERFCFREKYRLDHRHHAFCDSHFYASINVLERMASAVVQNILDHILSSYAATQSIAIRDSSFLQFCAYRPRHLLPGRAFLQDRHEDGNLLSLIHASCDGLIIYPDGQPVAVTPQPDEALIITGSILSLLTDHQVPFMDHAVKQPASGLTRSSLVYFALPELSRTYTSFVKHRRLDIAGQVNRMHQSFGNSPFT